VENGLLSYRHSFLTDVDEEYESSVPVVGKTQLVMKEENVVPFVARHGRVSNVRI
jgi:hypothetical protein